MKFLYEYRTSDNARHAGVIYASDREAAYSELKAKGIKPSRFAEAPGFFNKVFGKGKRWIAIVVLGIAVVVAFFVIQSNNRTIRTIEQSQNRFDSPVRRQILGDAAIVEKGIRTGWVDVFALEGDRFLASFAIPGVKAGVGTSSVKEIEKALAGHVGLVKGDGFEFRQIKAMVEGMKVELRQFLRDGGTIEQYGRRLVKRQDAEIAIYNRAKSEIETLAKGGAGAAELEELWERRNDELRAMGIRLISMPEGR